METGPALVIKPLRKNNNNNTNNKRKSIFSQIYKRKNPWSVFFFLFLFF